MKTPRFTDQHRYPTPYRPSSSTDIRKTFRRARREQAPAQPLPQPSTQEIRS